MRIEPEIGRHVHFWPAGAHKPYAAIIANVHENKFISIAYFDHMGAPHHESWVELIQPDQEDKYDRHRCRWMPYSVDQAKKKAEEAGV